jgi:hypothetical protein
MRDSLNVFQGQELGYNFDHFRTAVIAHNADELSAMIHAAGELGIRVSHVPRNDAVRVAGDVERDKAYAMSGMDHLL